MRIIYVNIAIFVILRLVSVVLTLAGGSPDVFMHFIEYPSNPELLLYRPWTIITYMFAQYDILHILFNMLWLYWFGAIFLQYFYPKQMFGLYIYGGIGGAVLYSISYNLLPYFTAMGGNAYMLGASASVIAIVVATALRAPDYKVGLLFLGAVSLKWIAAVTIFIDIISLDSSNAGGHIAHLGGAIVGAIFFLLHKNGIDITKVFNNIIDSCASLFKPQPKNYFGKKKYKYSPSSSGVSSRSASIDKDDMEVMNAILDKIKKSGYTSLSSEEKKRLFDVSKKQ